MTFENCRITGVSARTTMSLLVKYVKTAEKQKNKHKPIVSGYLDFKAIFAN